MLLSKIIASPTVITINSQNAGQSAFSNVSTITAEALGGASGGSVCLKSFFSELDSYTQLGNVDVPRKPQCFLGDEQFDCETNFTQCVTVRPGEKRTIPFRVEIQDRLFEISERSPYRAVIGFPGDVDSDPTNVLSDDNNVNVRFLYRVGDIRPH